MKKNVALVLSSILMFSGTLVSATDTPVEVTNPESRPVPVKSVTTASVRVTNGSGEAIPVIMSSSTSTFKLLRRDVSVNNNNLTSLDYIIINKSAVSNVQAIIKDNKYIVRIYFLAGNSQLSHGRTFRDDQKDASYIDLIDNSNWDTLSGIKSWLGV